jgi:hypothetical protein
MSVGKWIGLAMTAAACPVAIFAAHPEHSRYVFDALLFGGFTVFGLSPWREREPQIDPPSKAEPPSNDGPDATSMIIVAGL